MNRERIEETVRLWQAEPGGLVLDAFGRGAKILAEGNIYECVWPY
jgi:hypothetical protein